MVHCTQHIQCSRALSGMQGCCRQHLGRRR
jgi:hypothetical protein